MTFVCLKSEAAFRSINLVLVVHDQSVYDSASVAIDPPPVPEISPLGKESLVEKENHDFDLVLANLASDTIRCEGLLLHTCNSTRSI